MQISMGMRALSLKKIEKAEFDRRMEEHAKWLANHEEGSCADFSGLDLSGMDLSGKDLSYAKMEKVFLRQANFKGANLSHANFWGAYLHNSNLTGAVLDGTFFINTDLTLAKLDECKGERTRFTFSCMWECTIKNAHLKKADFFEAKVCDCGFDNSDLEEACFAAADFDNASFAGTNLRNADFNYAKRTYWSDFTNADMTGLSTADVDFDPKKLKGVKGLRMHMFCPEEGSFIAWDKCRDGKLVKLLIPEHAKRSGNTVYNCRASEAVVLDIFDKDGNSTDEAVNRWDKEFKYTKGKTVFSKESDPDHTGDVSGIYFVLSRADAEVLRDCEEGEEDDNS